MSEDIVIEVKQIAYGAGDIIEANDIIDYDTGVWDDVDVMDTEENDGIPDCVARWRLAVQDIFNTIEDVPGLDVMDPNFIADFNKLMKG